MLENGFSPTVLRINNVYVTTSFDLGHLGQITIVYRVSDNHRLPIVAYYSTYFFFRTCIVYSFLRDFLIYNRNPKTTTVGTSSKRVVNFVYSRYVQCSGRTDIFMCR